MYTSLQAAATVTHAVPASSSPQTTPCLPGGHPPEGARARLDIICANSSDIFPCSRWPAVPLRLECSPLAASGASAPSMVPRRARSPSTRVWWRTECAFSMRRGDAILESMAARSAPKCDSHKPGAHLSLMHCARSSGDAASSHALRALVARKCTHRSATLAMTDFSSSSSVRSAFPMKATSRT
jgi:hypothetical protein